LNLSLNTPTAAYHPNYIDESKIEEKMSDDFSLSFLERNDTSDVERLREELNDKDETAKEL